MYYDGLVIKHELRDICIYGTVYYKDGLVASNAIVVVEKINDISSSLIGYTVSDKWGKFLVRLEDRNSYYKISVFEGKLNGEFYSQ